MSDDTSTSYNKSNREAFNNMKIQNKRSYSMFVPGFCLGVLIHKLSKKYVTIEHSVARPWTAIWWGLFLGSAFNYIAWKKRLIIEEICIREELNERVNNELLFRRLKAGHDIENIMVMNYLKNEHNI